MIAFCGIKNTSGTLTFDKEDMELGVMNPYSCISCFILYLYSMEFGRPPLYAELNRVTRDMDLSELHTLGPIAYVLFYITADAEQNRSQDDKIVSGQILNN